MKYLKRIEINIEQINLIINNDIKFNDISISNLYLNIKKLENNSYSINFESNNPIIVNDFNFEDIVFKINDPGLYINYAKHVLKKSWKDSRGIIKDELVNKATYSIFNDLKHELETDSYEIGMSYEIGNSGIYEYVKELVKGRSPEFEKIILDYSNKNGGLKINGVPYNPKIDENTDKHYRTILDEVIYNYTITNRGGTWPEIGIHNREDLLKLRNQIVDHGTLQFRLRGYGELDY